MKELEDKEITHNHANLHRQFMLALKSLTEITEESMDATVKLGVSYNVEFVDEKTDIKELLERMRDTRTILNEIKKISLRGQVQLLKMQHLGNYIGIDFQ